MQKFILAYYPETINRNKFRYISSLNYLYEITINMKIEWVVINSGYDVGESALTPVLLKFGKPKNFIRDKFIEELKRADLIIGNSSSIVIEAPLLKIASILIGNRQQGRLMADSIIQAEPTRESIKKAFDRLYSKEFQDLMKSDYKIYYKGGNVAEKILKIIKEKMPLEIKKEFYDLAIS